MTKHPKPAAIRLPKRLPMTPDAVLALQTLEGSLGSPTLDGRLTRWYCGCTLWYFHISFGHLAETTRLEYCDAHKRQGSFFPPVPDRHPALPHRRQEPTRGH